MPRPDRLIACPSCACHVQASESRCPHCDAPIRQADGSVQRTAAALLLGLSTAVAGCGPTASPVYGTSATGGTAGDTGAGGVSATGGTSATGGATSTAGAGGGVGGIGGIGGTGGTGGMGGTGGAGGTGGDTNQPVYGAPPMTRPQ